MRGVRPPKDFLRPNKRPKFSDIPLNSSLPTRRELQRIEDSGGDITLKSNPTLTMRFIGKARRSPRYYTQGTMLFYDKETEDYMSLHEVNQALKGQGMVTHRTDDDVMKELIFFEITRRFRYIGVFRNVMPGNDAARHRNLFSRQPLMGLDVTGRTNVMDLFDSARTADTVHLGLFPWAEGEREFFQLVPMLNSGHKVAKELYPLLGERNMNSLCRCTFDKCLGLIHIGTVIRRPAQKILRNRAIAWQANKEKEAQAMNLLEIIMA